MAKRRGSRKSLVNGKRVGLTRNQRRKQAYAAMAKSRKRSQEEAGSQIASGPTNTGPKRKNKGHPMRQLRRETAQRLAEERAMRSSQEQLELLDKRLGKDQGAQKERTRLKAQIAVS
jgi:hypothetical protein